MLYRRVIRVAGSLFLVAALSSACAEARAPVHIVSTAMFAAWPPNERFERAVEIVEARITEVMPSRWDTADGRRPLDVREHVIYTDVHATVLRTWKGPAAVGTGLTIRLMGGTVGQDSMTAEDEVSLEAGEHAYLLLVPDPTDPDVWRVMHLGKYVQFADGTLSNGRETMAPLEFARMAEGTVSH